MNADSDIEQSEDEDNDDAERSLRQADDEYSERQQKKASARTAAFQSQKKALYNNGRKKAQDLVRDGVELANNMRTQIAELEAQEVSYEQQKEQFASLLKAMDQETNTLLGAARVIEDLNARRVTIIDACSNHAWVAISQCPPQSATDAKALIKQYKNILRAAGNE
ncbi:hypothetical protein EV122DRAFT_290177 [Schizophyllum commune]